MEELLRAFLPLLIILVGLGVMVGFPFGTMLSVVGRWGLILLAIGVIAPMTPAILDHLQKNPPRSLQELGIWLGFTSVIFLFFLRIIFGSGAIGRLFEKLVASAVYDVLKGLAKALFFGYRSFIKALLKLIG